MLTKNVRASKGLYNDVLGTVRGLVFRENVNLDVFWSSLMIITDLQLCLDITWFPLFLRLLSLIHEVENQGLNRFHLC